MSKYRLLRSPIGFLHIQRDDTTIIAQEESNPAYQEYLAWVAEGNTAEEWTGE